MSSEEKIKEITDCRTQEYRDRFPNSDYVKIREGRVSLDGDFTYDELKTLTLICLSCANECYDARGNT